MQLLGIRGHALVRWRSPGMWWRINCRRSSPLLWSNGSVPVGQRVGIIHDNAAEPLIVNRMCCTSSFKEEPHSCREEEGPDGPLMDALCDVILHSHGEVSSLAKGQWPDSRGWMVLISTLVGLSSACPSSCHETEILTAPLENTVVSPWHKKVVLDEPRVAKNRGSKTGDNKELEGSGVIQDCERKRGGEMSNGAGGKGLIVDSGVDQLG